jgi:phosphatidylserine/phosphatidylglycerophosphate/cardiolipin synthase-like enzyme
LEHFLINKTRPKKFNSSLHTLVMLTLLLVNVTAVASDAIEAYFNQYEQASYTDPYRNIERRGHNLEKVMIDAINSAKKSIYVAVQEIRLPLIAKALVERKSQGLDVRVILENQYNNDIRTIIPDRPAGDDSDPDEHEASRYIDFFALVDLNGDGIISEYEQSQRDAVYILKKGGITVKDDTFNDTSGSGLMHHKFIVIDGREVLVGTANFTMSCIHGDILAPSTTGNANSLLKFTSLRLASFFTEEFLLMWGGLNKNTSSRFGLGKPYRGKQSTTIYGTSVSVQFSPTSKKDPWKKSVNGLIATELEKSRYEVLMALFVFSEQRFTNILQKKYETSHQFKIGLLIEPKFAYRNYSELLDMWGLQLPDENCQYQRGNRPWTLPLYDVGVPVLPRGDMLHHKFAVIDDQTVVVGSQNWSDAANHGNDENLLIIKNARIAKMYKDEFNRLEYGSRKGPPKTLLKRISQMQDACGLAPYYH